MYKWFDKKLTQRRANLQMIKSTQKKNTVKFTSQCPSLLAKFACNWVYDWIYGSCRIIRLTRQIITGLLSRQIRLPTKKGFLNQTIYGIWWLLWHYGIVIMELQIHYYDDWIADCLVKKCGFFPDPMVPSSRITYGVLWASEILRHQLGRKKTHVPYSEPCVYIHTLI